MQTYLALLRGVNVSGQKKIKMAELRQHLSEAGYMDVQTYIQSGNIIFQHPLSDIPSLEKSIQDLLLIKYGFDVDVLILADEDFLRVVADNPFLNQSEVDPKFLHVTFLLAEVDEEKYAAIPLADYEPEELMRKDQTCYLYMPNGYGRAKMTNSFFEKKLKIPATTRNWRTMRKLEEMIKG
ncbi:MAG: DUF1697 domain-containing protein [Bacteroidota bacterium]